MRRALALTLTPLILFHGEASQSPSTTQTAYSVQGTAYSPPRTAHRGQRSGFEHVGVIEGFYGTPWSHQDRLDVLHFMGRVGLDTYVYAPKDDPYHRARWREPYPARERARLTQLIRTARANGVAFWYAISPGGSMVYSDSTDYAALLGKIDAVLELGRVEIALLLDDVPQVLTHPADRRVFDYLAQAHATLIRRLYRDLEDRGVTLSVTPTTYTDAWGDREYLRRLGRAVPKAVPFFWTGMDVASPHITAAQAGTWTRLTGRRPIVWDNYPVNDYARWRLFLGPFTGRAPDLANAVVGLVANPMNEAHASMIALATLAQYARDPAGYDAGRARNAAVADLYGAEAAGALRPFLAVYGGYGWEEHVFGPLFIPRDTVELSPIRRALAELDAALAELRQIQSTGGEPLDPLVAELAPFVEETRTRLTELEADTLYRRLGDRLVFRREADRFVASRAAAARVNGNLSEWNDAAWHALRDAEGRPAPGARVAFRSDAERLYIALRVEDDQLVVEGGERTGMGDHVQLILDAEPGDGPPGLTPNDLVILVPPPDGDSSATPVVTAMQFQGFMSKWLADNRRLTFTDFHLSSFATPPRQGMAAVARGLRQYVRRTERGYVMELALPRAGRDSLFMSLGVVDTDRGRRRMFSLTARNFPANPVTFGVVVMR